MITFSGVFIARGKEDALVTKNLVPGDSVYGEKRISVEVRIADSVLVGSSPIVTVLMTASQMVNYLARQSGWLHIVFLSLQCDQKSQTKLVKSLMTELKMIFSGSWLFMAKQSMIIWM